MSQQTRMFTRQRPRDGHAMLILTSGPSGSSRSHLTAYLSNREALRPPRTQPRDRTSRPTAITIEQVVQYTQGFRRF